MVSRLNRLRLAGVLLLVSCLIVAWMVAGRRGESGAPAAPTIAVVKASARGAATVPVVQNPREAPAQGAARRPLANFDLRAERAGRQGPLLPPRRIAAVAQLKKEFPGVAVDFDPVTKSAKWVGSNAGLLSGKQADAAARDADAPVRQFVNAHAEVFGHGASALDGARRVTDYATAKSGSRKVVWHQQLDGIDIFEAVFQANLTAGSELINLGSQMVADPEAAAGAGIGSRAALLAAPPVAVEQAVAAAGQNVGELVTGESVHAMGPPGAEPDRRQQFRAAMLTDADARLAWLAMDESTLRLAWDVTLSSRSRGEMYRVLVDAQTGGVLVRQALTAYLTDATYRVYTSESPTPFSPGHEKPSSLQPANVERVLVTTPALNTTASPNGWINDGGTMTSGNNSDAYTDTNADNVADLPRTQNAGRVFDFPMNLTQEPGTYKDASVTQLFYWTNFVHDKLYDLGFTEAAGNFQVDNFGRGGLANDPVNSEAQDGSGTDNANFSTPVDGNRGRMQMFNWTGATPDRDGSFEAEVVLHEYCHGLSNRLVGGPSVTISALASAGMGEGWSDFYGLALTAEAKDNPHGNWARGGYSRYQIGGWYSENYYYGGRRYSYSTDMLKNPFTFRDIDPAQVNWHTSVPRNPTFAATEDASEVHYTGSVWCAMLWDLRANLILKHGFAIGNDRALFLVTEGMKLGPANPNFVQSRDGILQATLVNFPADLGEVWTAFAKRGMGAGAAAPASSTTTGVTESYTVPDSLEIDNRGGWNITGDAGGAFLPGVKTLTLINDGAAPLSWSVNPNAPWLSVAPASGTISPGQTATVAITTQASEMEAGFYSTNVVVTNTTSGFNQPIGVRLYVTPAVAFSFNLSSNPGWTTTGEWAFGPPSGGGGTSAGGSGNPDPAAGATGGNVFGVNLAGNHSTPSAGPFYLTTAPVNLSPRIKTRLRFQRWLNTSALTNTRVTVEISTDGANWREVFVNPNTAITDSAWTQMDYDISTIADKQPAVQVRWSYRTNAAPGAYSGWNIDDVQFLGESTAQFSLNIATSVSEGKGPFSGTLTLNQPQPNPITVTMTSSDPTAATVPATLKLAAGQVLKNFTITPVRDDDLDGDQATVITAAAPNVGPASATLKVLDDESAVLTLNVPATVTEGQLALTGNISVNKPPSRNIQVTLNASSDALSVPATVTIPSGSTAPVSFAFSAPDNAYAEGVKSVVLTASVSGWTPGKATVGVRDDESAAIIITGPSSVREGDPAQPFTVTVNTAQSADLTVSLATSDVARLTVPASAVIPAGQFSASFNAVIVDNLLSEGTKSVTLTASRAGYASGSRVVSIADDDVHHYSIAPIASPQKRNKPIPVVVTAKDINDAVITNRAGTLTLSTNSSGGGIPFAGAVMNAFANGTAAGSLTVTSQATAMTVKVSDTNAKSGVSNAFDVEPVVHDSFAWYDLPAGFVQVDTPFSATAMAKDDQDNVATSYNSPTKVEAYMPVFDRTAGPTGTSVNTTKIYNTAAHDSRAQIIYTAAEFGGAPRWIGSVAFSLATVGGLPMQNFTLRMKHTDLENFDGASWDNSGWTTVYSSASLSASNSYLIFTKPFYFNGTQNVMLDVSFDNSTSATAGALRCVAATGNRVLSGSSDSANGAPAGWTAALGPVPELGKEVPTLSLFAARSYGPVPASPVSFSQGVASVSAFAPTPANGGVWLLATAPSGASGFSSVILISTSTGPVSTGTVFSDGFETGTLGAAWSTAGSSGATARTVVTTSNTPKAGSYHLTMDTTSTATGTFARNSPTLTLDLAGRTNVSLEWFAKGFLEDPHTPTLTGPLGTFGSNMNSDSVSISQDGITWCEVASLASLPSSYSASATSVFLDPIIQRLGWAYNSTFRIRFSQYDDQAIPNDGIAIDNVAVKANPATAIALSLPPSINEGTLNFPVTVTLPAAPATNVTVSLASSAPARLTLPTSVTILANQTTATVMLSAPQNQYADIGRDVIVTASASGQTTSYNHIRVIDDEHPVLAIALPPSIVEGGGTATGVLAISPMVAAPVTVYLTSSDPAQATVGASTGINTGYASASFAVIPVNDIFVDGNQTVTITAIGDGVASASAAIDVLDNEGAQLAVTPPASLREGGPPGVGTVSISGPRTSPTVVTLTSSDVTEATVSASVVIPTGQTSTNFLVFPIEDSLQDGSQTVTLSAASPGLTTGSATVQVQDNDPSFLVISPISSSQVRNAAFAVTITATDGAGLTLSAFNGTGTLSALSGSAALPVNPDTPITFANGLWTGNVSIGGAAGSVTLRVIASGGKVGFSNSFAVTEGGVATKLVFKPIASPQIAGREFLAEVFAADANGIRVNEVNGPVTVEMILGNSGPVVASSSLTFVDGAAKVAYTLPSALPALSLRATAGVLSGSTGIFAITDAPHLIYQPPELLFADDFESGSFKPEWTITGMNTHRTLITTAQSPRGQRHMVMDSSVDSSLSRNEATLILNLAGKSDVVLTFWEKEMGDEDHGPPASPFVGGADFDGVAISADGINWYEVQPLRGASSTEAYQKFTLNLNTLAASKGITLTSAFKIRFNHYDDYTAPTDGFAFDDISVIANAGSSPEPAWTVFQEDFESGLFRPEWQLTGSGNQRTIITSEQAPRGQYHMVMDANPAGNGRNEATLTLNLAGMQKVALKFLMKENSDEDHEPPSNPFTDGADFDGIAISADGSTWYEVQPLRGAVSTNAYQLFTVDLDAALAAYGLTYNANFKIRFNHFDNSSWIGGDGFAFDDISVTCQPNGLTLAMPATLMEGATASGQLTMTPVRAVDTTITLQANRPGSLSLPASVTLPAGHASVTFNATATENTLLTGPLAVEVLASGPEVGNASAVVSIQDNEQLTRLSLNLAGVLVEGGAVDGSVTISPATLADVTVSLAAAPSLGVDLPATLLIPAGTNTASFTVTRPENTVVLEGPSVEVTASFGTLSHSKTLALPDNDTAGALVLTLPSSVVESAGQVPCQVGFAAPQLAGRDVVVDLTSLQPGLLAVPPNVTLPAGQRVVSFNATVIDNALQDGARTVTVNAAALGLTGSEKSLTVLDDELHHITVDAVASPQRVSFPFNLILRGLTIDDQSAAIAGVASLSATSAGAPLALSTGTAAAFLNGVSTTPLAINAIKDQVVITAVTAGGLTASSNAFSVAAGPRLTISPNPLMANVPAGEVATRNLTLANGGGVATDWSASVVYAGAQPDLPLAETLSVLNSSYASITALIPNRYDFSEGVTGTGISDGGNDMYDGGNYLDLNITTAPNTLNYSDNVIATSANLGAGGRYFTRKLAGLFVLAADVANLDHFKISGGLGADGSGSTNTAVLTSARVDGTYKGFVKRVYGTSDPSVNHLIIIKDNGAATHSASTNTDYDDHALANLAGVTRIYYLLFASASGGQVSDNQMQAIMEAFLDRATAPAWLSIAPAAGSIPTGENRTAVVSLNSAFLAPGAYSATLRFTSNDGVTPSQDVPVTLNMVQAVDHFTWSVVPSPQVANVPFAATLTAFDSSGAVSTSFNGSANLKAWSPQSDVLSGAGTTLSSLPFYGYDLRARLQNIYLPAEVGPPGRLQSLALNVGSYSGMVTLKNFTIRVKHTTKSSYTNTADSTWETADWTTVYSGTAIANSSGWQVFPCNSAFDYDGVRNLMVDFSYDDDSTDTINYVYSTTKSPSRSLTRTTSSGNPSPMTWQNNTPQGSAGTALQNVRFSSRVVSSVSPETVTFSSGVWSGDIAVQSAGANLMMQATHATRPAVVAESNGFAVTSGGSLTLSVAASGVEGASLPATVTANPAPVTPQVITLTSSDLTEATVPASVTIPGGQSTASFTVSLVDDAILDGGVPVVLTATAPNYNAGVAKVIVTDNDTTTVTVDLPASIVENGAAQSAGGTVTLGMAAASDLIVSLNSSDTTELTVPASVIIPAGKTSASFALTPVDDSLLDGDQIVTVTATLAGGAGSGFKDMTITDNETRTFTVSQNVTSRSESAGLITSAGTIYLTGTAITPVVIPITSGDLTEMLDSSVTIPAGSSSANYNLTTVDDVLKDGTQTVTLTASSPSFTSRTFTFNVTDDELSNFLVTVPSPQVRGAPFSATVTARDINNATIAGYAGTVNLTAMNGAIPLAITPTSATGFSNGSQVVSMTVLDLANAAVLTATDPANGGSFGSSSPFIVGGGAIDHFTWDAVPPQQSASAGAPISVTLSARDIYENVVTGYTAPVSVIAVTNYAATTSGSGSLSDWQPFGGYNPQNRCQMIYLPAEVGATARSLKALAFNMATPNSSYPATTLSNLIIRLKHTTKASYTGTGNAVWDSTGWTTVYSGTAIMNQAGWLVLPFATAFDYNGTDNLMVDVSSNSASFGNRVESRYSTAVSRLLYAFTSGTTAPATWAGTTPSPNSVSSLPNLRLLSYSTVPSTPAQTGAFAAGSWTGDVALTNSVTGVRLLALNGLSGISSAFDVYAALPVPTLASAPPFTRGLASTRSWTITPAGSEVSIQSSLTPAFSAPFETPWSTGNSYTFGSLMDGAAYYYRARSRVLGSPPVAETWTQTAAVEFQTDSLVNADAVSVPGNVRLAAGFAPAGSVTSGVIAPANSTGWSLLKFSKVTPTGTTLTVDVLDSAGAMLVADVASNTNLSALPSVAGRTSIRLRANLATTNTSVTPELLDWSVSWLPATPYVYSAWSNIVTSTQDATPPSLSAAEFTTAASATVLAGTATDATSGIASVTVSGDAAATSDGFAHWTYPIVALVDGSNSYTVIATDKATPPNTITAAFVIFRLSTPERVDRFGISDLIDHALGIPANSTSPQSLLPVTRVEKDPETGESFLTIDYRRRIKHGGLQYLVETSDDLVSWNTTDGDVIESSVTPTGDGIMERVRVRITPALSAAPTKFGRLRITFE